MNFSKMHGLGNDFLIFEDDGISRDWNALAAKTCQRRLGVGADGILIVMPSSCADIKMRIINADGSEAEMCGNGIRCFAKYVYEKEIVENKDMTVETLAGIIRPGLTVQNKVVTNIKVDMGKPSYDRADIPMTGQGEAFDVKIQAAGESVTITSVLMGVPHTMVLTEKIDEDRARILGPAIETHELFPRKTNVNFVKIIDQENIELLTWERGAGLTLACGTGSCASVIAMHKKGLVGSKVTVHLAVGELIIECMDDGRVMMTGPAAFVYNATLTE